MENNQFTVNTLNDFDRKELTLIPFSSFGNFQVKPIKCFKELNDGNIILPFNYNSKTIQKNNIILEEKKIRKIHNEIVIRKGAQSNALTACLAEKGKPFGGGIINLQTGGGKCLGRDIKIMMFDGSIKKSQDIAVGNVLLGDDSTPRVVLSVSTGKGQLYEIYNKYLDKIICNGDHILTLKNDIKLHIGDTYILEYFCYYSLKINYKIFKTLNDAVRAKNMIKKILDIVEITVDDYIKSNCELGMYLCIPSDNVWDYKISDPYNLGKELVSGKMSSVLIYSKENRLEILAGVIDNMESYYNYYHISHPDEEIKKEIKLLFRSLGFLCNKDYMIYYKISDNIIPVRVSIPVYIPKIVNSLDISISKYDNSRSYYGFEISGNRRFVLGDFSVTHNTVLGVKLITEFSQRTLIIVNKVELMRQWESEIKKFTPEAKIGVIQGKRFDSEGYDIVIGMLQSISLKETLTSSDFKAFGMCIIDEAHNIASEMFSKIMWKIRPKYLFGLTATLERKDRTEQLIKWYIGDIIFSDKDTSLKQTTDIYIYKFIGASSVPKELRDGTAAVSTMLTNIASDPERNKLIIKIVKGLLKESNRNILIIGDRTAQLKFIGKVLGENISGLFIGGMKKELLEKSKESRVILGTYGMVNEGFNLPKLNCLIFATPRSSITQAIGRIFRKQHQDITPVIVDIVDDFSIFKSQQYARKKIYRKAIMSPMFLQKNFTEEPKESNNDELTECLI
jgi:hypothetical protein